MKTIGGSLQSVRSLAGMLRAIPLRGDRYHCPICNRSFKGFLPAGVVKRPNARCPRCNSFERHRLLWLYLQRETGLFGKPHAILHCAPEPSLRRRLRSLPQLDYRTVDKFDPAADYRMDLTALDFEPGSFDAILCMHVLEHVSDDITALREFLRVLKPGGFALVGVPVDKGRETTFEDVFITSPAERRRVFGQEDHVRVYGRDYARRFESAGLAVTVVDYYRHLAAEERERYSLMDGDEFVICKKS